MTRTRIITAAVIFIVLVSIAIWQRQQLQRMEAYNAGLREKAGQLQGLKDEHERLVAQLKEPAGLSSAEQGELLKLRAKVPTTERMAKQNVMLQAEVDRATKPADREQTKRDNPYDDQYYGQNSEMRFLQAQRWHSAILNYTKAHQGKFPALLQDATSYLNDEGYAKYLSVDAKAQTASLADQYELVYHGTMAAMTNPPPEGTIVLREKQPRQSARGKWLRYYVNGAGGGQYVSSDDGNYEQYESIRMPRINEQ